jgi:hypothetical protein
LDTKLHHNGQNTFYGASTDTQSCVTPQGPDVEAPFWRLYVGKGYLRSC